MAGPTVMQQSYKSLGRLLPASAWNLLRNAPVLICLASAAWMIWNLYLLIFHEHAVNLQVYNAERKPPAATVPFDILTIMRTPTCVNYFTVRNAVKYLKSKGLRKVFVATPGKFVAGINAWDPAVVALDEGDVFPGVTKDGIKELLKKYGWDNPLFDGRTSAGWYLMQFLNLAFSLSSQSLDIVLMHDADQMFLPRFEMFGAEVWKNEKGESLPQFSLKVGGLEVHQYEYAYTCLTGSKIKYPMRGRGSYVTHTWPAYRPFARELLDAFGYDKVREHRRKARPGGNGTAAWVENIIQCLNPKSPWVGFGESCSYLTLALERHREAFDVQPTRTWTRNIEYLRPRSDGYCCPTDEVLAEYTRRGYEYVGFELGHQYNKHCGYSNNDYFMKHPYPPANNSFWLSKNIHWGT
eukprot:TRINITY_DN24480_c0_g1_i1.p1 TRINITY_DN24480_c0_g1~~TRINITY_DN24480_c0_g1_i1.p1  ORF type:complete len:409 (+),score=49.87 TRINITY_DN24480_c0_g1_i1:60-1286(+)